MQASGSAQQVWYEQGSFVAGVNPHRVVAPSAPTPFYSIAADGSLTPTPQNLPGAYPYGPIYPNASAFFSSLPGKVDLQFGGRPFIG